MYKFLIFLSFYSLIIGCKSKDGSNQTMGEAISKSDSAYVAGDTIKLDALSNNQRQNIAGVIEFVGKKPSEIGLFEKFELPKRLSSMMGDQYAEFTKNWNVDTPLKKEAEIVFSSGCNLADCHSKRYAIIFDTKINLINIYVWTGSSMRTFQEDRTIVGLPYATQDWFEAIMEEQNK